ncbi:hypothetical protein ACHMWU_03350 [Aeromicrobium sp. UC242_57]
MSRGLLRIRGLGAFLGQRRARPQHSDHEGSDESEHSGPGSGDERHVHELLDDGNLDEIT